MVCRGSICSFSGVHTPSPPAIVQGAGGVALVDPGPTTLPRHARARPAGARHPLGRRAPHPADAHPPRSRRRHRDDRPRASAHHGVRARARRAAHDRSGEAARQRDAAVRRRDGSAVGRVRAGAGGEPGRRWPAASGSRPAGERSTSPTRRATRRITSATSTRRAAWRSSATSPGVVHRRRLRAAADAAAGHRPRGVAGQRRRGSRRGRRRRCS